MLNDKWYDVEAVRNFLISRRHSAAHQMYLAIQDGDEGTDAAANWNELNYIIGMLDAKKPAAGATATDDENTSTK